MLAATEAVEALEAEDDRNITPVYVRYRAAHMNALLGMLDTYLDRIDDGVHATLNVLRDNIQRVAA
ncbi:hypothetical protein [Sphingomonas sp.]|uniref:hypothetical protein n=1 Tax=Sphingomonas sp. TaxID=28214 RepID=UPI0031E2D983